MPLAFVIGRVGVDLTPAIPRTSLADATSFVRAVGGFAGNIGVGLARLGVPTTVVGAVGDDGHGRHVRATLQAEGIDDSALISRPGLRTQVAFFEAWPPEEFPVTFYRVPPSPETLLIEDELPLRDLEAAPLVIVSGSLLAADPARTTVISLLARRAEARARRPRSWTILDLDWRPTLWHEPDDYPGLVERAAAMSDVLIGSDAEFAAARLHPEEAVGEGPGLVVIKHGSAGVTLLSGGGRTTIAATPVEVSCGLGAGDALTAAFGAGLVGGLDPVRAVERGSAAGAIVAGRLMCSSAMPTSREIDAILDRPFVSRKEPRP